MANSYSAPDFDIDTDATITELETLKGSALALTDKIWIVAGATVTADKSFSCLQIILGTTSGGAAGAGQRYGHFSATVGGIKITFAGATWNTSGIFANPTSADASSKDCSTTIQGEAGNLIELVNDGEADDNTKSYSIAHYYGTPNISYADIRYAYDWVVYLYGFYTERTNATTMKLDHNVVYAGARSSQGDLVVFGWSGDKDMKLDIDVSYTEFHGNPAVGSRILEMSGDYIGTGSIDWTGLKLITNANMEMTPFARFSLGKTGDGEQTCGLARTILGRVDNSPTKTVPTTPAATDPVTSGDLTITWANKASYSSGDLVYVYNNSGDSVLGILDATDGTGTITGLTNDQEYTMYLKASSDNYIFSSATSTFTGTPTAGANPTNTGTFTASRIANQNGLKVDISGLTLTNATHVYGYIRAGSTPTTSDNTYLAAVADPSDTYIYFTRDADGTQLKAGTDYYVKVEAVIESTQAVNSNEDTATVVGFLELAD